MNRRSLALVALAALLVLLTWWQVGADPERRAAGAGPSEPRAADSAVPAEPVAHQASRTPATTTEPARSPELAPETPVEVIDLHGEFINPGGGQVRVTGTVELSAQSGAVRVIPIEDAGRVTVDGLAPDLYTLAVHADGFAHQPQRFDLREPRLSQLPTIPTGRYFRTALFVWPSNCVALVVRTSDGRSIGELAQSLGLSAAELRLRAFRTRTTAEPPLGHDARGEQGVAMHLIPPQLAGWELPAHVVGSLRLFRDPPIWVALDFLDQSLGWREISPGASEVEFTLDANAFTARLASLSLRVVDGENKPRSNALVTLRSFDWTLDATAFANRQTDASGRAKLAHVPPGRYEISLEREDAQLVDFVELAPGEARDLGTTVLPDGAAIEVQVLAAHGRPVRAAVQIAPYRREAFVDELFAERIWRDTDEAGVLSMPLPSSPVIVRALVRDAGTDWTAARATPLVLVDPILAAPQRLTLAARPTLEIELDLTLPGTVEILDELDCIVFRQQLRRAEVLRTRLTAGSYGLRHTGTDGLRVTRAFHVGSEPVELRIP